MRSTLLACVAIATFSAPVLCQELIQNGDFSSQLTGWTGSGPGQLIGTNGLTSYDVNAQGSNACFGMRPGGNSYNPPHAPYKLTTSVQPMITSLYYEVNLDVAVTTPNANAQGGIIEVWIAGKKVAEWTRFVGSIKAGSYRDRLCGRFQYTGPAGKQTVEFHIARPRYIWSSRTPVFYIDNISLQRTNDPVVCWVGERAIGTSMTIAIHGEASAAVALFIAGKNINPISIPGITGSWELDLASFAFLMSGALNTSGTLSASVPIPNVSALAGKPLWWQGLQIGKNGASLSRSYNVAVY